MHLVLQHPGRSAACPPRRGGRGAESAHRSGTPIRKASSPEVNARFSDANEFIVAPFTGSPPVRTLVAVARWATSYGSSPSASASPAAFTDHQMACPPEEHEASVARWQAGSRAPGRRRTRRHRAHLVMVDPETRHASRVLQTTRRDIGQGPGFGTLISLRARLSSARDTSMAQPAEQLVGRAAELRSRDDTLAGLLARARRRARARGRAGHRQDAPARRAERAGGGGGRLVLSGRRPSSSGSCRSGFRRRARRVRRRARAAPGCRRSTTRHAPSSRTSSGV